MIVLGLHSSALGSTVTLQQKGHGFKSWPGIACSACAYVSSLQVLQTFSRSPKT